MAKKTNFTVNDKNYFRVTATVGFDEKGERIRKTFYGESKKDAEAKRDEYLVGIKNGLSMDYDKITFGQMFENWFNVVHKVSIGGSTYERYEIDYRLRIKPSEIYIMQLKDINSMHIQKMYNKIKDKYGCNAVRCVHKLLRIFIRYCLEEDIILKNPLKTVKLPVEREIDDDDDDEEIEILSHKSVIKIINAVDNNIENLIFLFAILTGLRQGECIALTHNNRDMNLVKKKVSVTKSARMNKIFYENGTSKYVFQITKPKNDYSIRTVPLFDKLIPYLELHIEHEIEKHERLGLKITDKTPFFTSRVCKYIDAKNLLKRWKKLCKKLDIDYVCFHKLRHTFISLLAENNVPMKTASVLAGHSSIEVTDKIYAHVRSEQKEKAIASLESIWLE